MTPHLALAESIARRIFEKALDRLDRASAEDRINAVRIPIDVDTAPEIFSAETNADRELAWHVLKTLEQDNLGRIEFGKAARHGAFHERKPVFVISMLAEDRIRGAYGRPRRGPSYSLVWQRLVDSSALSEQAKDIIRKLPIAIADRKAEEVFERLMTIQEKHDPKADALLREISARAFWGLSKILDARHDLVAALLDLDECPYADQPIHLSVYFAGAYDGRLLFIENKTSFERAIRDIHHAAAGESAYAGMAVIYCSGFVGSSRNLRKSQSVRLFHAIDEISLAASIELFKRDLFSDVDVPTYFWGDLDYSGMAILHHLRGTFRSAMAWEPGYALMLGHLLTGVGHTPEEARKEGQRPIELTGCRYADEALLPAIRAHGRFVDQEGFRVVGVFDRPR
ncbi:Wadjet anti-phage system protein JetD domain-containing protein [Mesorhizobium sp.]|uniref:Wadjet anti-phage system protein JetD domain-containing protein n=1 Tax=Mesorhizobium sp. TaxID=1871066 RepID=UPI00257A5CFF|nr:Wadjet anti-phage system protein JetD domain-containing protein [Mesorhizobium sp.]